MKVLLTASICFAFTSLLIAKEVSITIDEKTLHGELKTQEQNKSLAAFILAGSGPTDRNGNTVGAAGKNNSLKYLAEALNKEGITTLNIDKRGVGASAKAAIKESDLRFSNYVEDAKQWIKFLEKQGYTEIILMGHSEGALVATMAASSKSVKGLISIAGAGRPASVVLKEQLKSNLPEKLYTESDKVITSLLKGEIVKDLSPSLNSLFRPNVQPYLISWLPIDPAKEISKVQVPVLIIQGTTDFQISMKDAKLLNTSAKESSLIIVDGMNHILKAVRGPRIIQLPSYFDPNLPLHKDLIKGITEFIKTTLPQS